MKNFIRKYITVLGIISILLILFISGFFLYKIQKKIYLQEETNKRINTVKTAENFIFEQYAQNKKTLVSSQRFVKFFFEDSQNISLDSANTVKITAQKKDETFTKTFKLSSVKIKNKLFKNLETFVDKQLYINNVFCEIWQKSGNNFVRTASSKTKEKNKPVFINLSEEPAKTVLTGSNYFKTIQSESDLKFILSFPIYINGKITFFVNLENNHNILSAVNILFSNSNEKILIINKDEKIISGNKTNLPETLNLRKNFVQETDGIKMKSFENGNKLYFRFIPELSIYIGYLQNDSELNSPLTKLKRNIFLILLFPAIAAIFLLIFIKYKSEQKKSNLISSFEHLLPNHEQNINSIEEITSSMRKYLSDIAEITNEIAEGKYESAVSKKYKNNQLFKNLERIQNAFLKTKLQEAEQTTELKLKETFDKSALQISEILQYASDLEDLSYKIIKHISEFIGAEQIALFIVDEDLQKNKSLKMTAAYAYSKQRTAHKELSINEGLTGRAYLEKKSVFLTEIPDNYTFIESGFGFQKPNCLLIFPLIFNNDVQALIEIGSIRIIDENQINFLEDVGKNIASTIANLKHSKQTEFLLKQTTEQSKEIEEQRKTLEEKINTHRKQNRNLDKQILQLIEIIDSIKSVSYLIEYDLKGNIMDVSSKVINLFEAEKKDFISKSHKDIIKTTNYAEAYQNFWKDLEANKTQYIEETIQAGDKEIKMKQTYVPIRNVRRKIYRILSVGIVKE